MVEADRFEAVEAPDEAEALLDPNIGALTQIVEEHKPDGAPVVGVRRGEDIDTIAKQVQFTGWSETQKATHRPQANASC